MLSYTSVPPRLRRRLSRALYASVSTSALLVGVPALADESCPAPAASGGSYTCTLDGGGDGYVVLSGSAATVDYTLTNDVNRTYNTDYNTGGSANAAIYMEFIGAEGTGSSPDGGDGSTFTVTNNGTITLTGTSAQDSQPSNVAGIYLRSEGGTGVQPDDGDDNGGRGGDGAIITLTNNAAVTIESSATQDLSANLYGLYAYGRAGTGGAQGDDDLGEQSGGNSGDGKEIEVYNHATITMGEADSHIRGANSVRGILVQSHGNDGGTDNGSGGTGGTIGVTNDGAINMYYQEVGDGTYGLGGIYAVSRGGNGQPSFDNSDDGGKGESGRVITIHNSGDIHIETSGNPLVGESAGIYALSQGGNGGASANKSVGGVGGGASINTDETAGVLTITHSDASIFTQGDGIRGIVARSSGGNGGDGNGDSDSTGGAGGSSGAIQVNLTDQGSIETSGTEGYGILAQSVGGIGGSNANTAGRGGDAGAVGVYTAAGTSITTHGDYSAALTFHSVGGGGGTGDDFTGVLAGSGGNGGNGGDAEKVTLTTAATITTSGEHSYGLLGQSIGGAGGTGGVGAGLVLALGGEGGAGGAAGVVELNNTGSITTSGAYAVGILGQSISGGGGAGGAAGGLLSVGGTSSAGQHNTATSYVTNSGDVTTTGAAAVGIVMQSIGGGGGNGGGSAGMVTVGGGGTAGGNGGTANVYAVDGTVSTAGAHAFGILAQSIGGGGGNGGDVYDVSVGFGLGVGGSSSSGGSGGTACATNTYNNNCAAVSDADSAAPQGDGVTVATTGEFAHGVIVQSIGGGGGNGGSATGANVASLAAFQVGGSGGGGGIGGSAKAAFHALTLSTTGANAKGLIVQSLGGGGGNGGNSSALGAGVPLDFQIGGSGGGGGGAGTAMTVLNSSSVATSGANASGILTQSVGGGGGSGGSAFGADASLGFTMDTAIGGRGAGGGDGANATVSLTDTAVTTGFDADGNALGADAASSHGISVQSIGGGGGTGGTAAADALTAAVPTGEGVSVAFSSTLSMGGVAGGGGVGGTVEATLSGTSVVTTGGDGGHGILAQSVGGGGGDGGSASAASGSIGVPDTVSADVAAGLGGYGGSGGQADTVTVTLHDSAGIATFGENSNGITAQSVGGGGGDGGIGNATNDKIGRGMNFSADIGLGGAGGGGGVGNTVTVTLDPGTTITTAGSGSRGVVAQSVGGGGGTGQGGSVGFSASGFTPLEAIDIRQEAGAKPDNILKINAAAAVTLNVGATTGTGNTGGTVNVTSNGAITTTGNDADGIFAQSIGGGGGLAGSAGSSSGNSSGPSLPRLEIAVDTSYGITASIGGKGGTGGNGGAVNVTAEGPTTTTGDFSDGIVAQSVGGGGGTGGGANTGDGDQTVSVDFSIGGNGGAGGNGGSVTLQLIDNHNLSVNTSGYAAHGVLAQSIGGGGGQGAVGTDTATGRLSVGGGYGGNGGAAGNGGTITIAEGSYYSASTQGDDAYALFAQSIGGGGGTGGVGASVQNDDVLDIDVDVTVGGSGGSSGTGGAVNINTGTDIHTHGDRAFGILAQSIGGGGGVGGATSDDNLANITFTSKNGSSGSSSPVDVTITSGQIYTHGEGSHALIVQAIGGGGGIAGDLGSPTLDASFAPLYQTDSSSGEGSGSPVTVNANVNIVTSGESAHGIIAQSVGGGGGLWGQDGVLHAGTTGAADGDGGNVTVNQSSLIQATGRNSIGIFAQSVGTLSFGEIDVTVNGDVTGGSEDGAGVYISEGDTNTLTIAAGGSVSAGGSSDDGTRGRAVVYRGSFTTAEGTTLTVTNNGTINGDVSLVNADSDDAGSVSAAAAVSAAAVATPGIAGTVHNTAGGTWVIDSLAEAHVLNAGRIVLGPEPRLRTARIEGDFRQMGTGELVADVDFMGQRGDLLSIGGDASFGGTLTI
uniref:beta strand repeat-containing protein n=1 Tax=Oceanicella sp. SM1341 TaxID=1548889 RepID=UPI000E4AAA1B